MKISHNRGIEARTAGGQVAHLRAQSGVDFLKKDGARVDADFAQRAIQRDHRAEHLPRNRAAFGNLLKQTLVNQVEKLRHDRECGDVTLA